MNGHGHDNIGDSAELTRQELLLSRVVDGEASDAEWNEFRAIADGQIAPGAPLTWRDLAESQRTQALMSAAVGDELVAAERVEAPAPHLRLVGGPALRQAVAIGGWMAVAAAVLLAWANGWMARPLGPNGPGSQASILPTIPAGYELIESPEDGRRAYLTKGKESGRVLEELPQLVLVQARPKPGEPGIYEVVYLRQFLERAEVTDPRRFGQDEAGRATLVRASIPAAPQAGRNGY